MSLLVNTTRYVADASEVVRPTVSAPGDLDALQPPRVYTASHFELSPLCQFYTEHVGSNRIGRCSIETTATLPILVSGFS